MGVLGASRAPTAAHGASAPSPRWVLPRTLVGALSVAYLTSLAALVAYTVLPLALGWSTYVVQSESMAPSLRVGDALVTSPVSSNRLEAGQIVVVRDPAVAGRLLSHRVVRVRPDGFVVTRGDANTQADSTPVPPDDVRGLARLRVPWVGLPPTWLAQGEWERFAGWFLVSALAVCGAVTDPARRGRGNVGRRPPRSRRRRHRRRARAAAGVSAVAMLLVALAVQGPSMPLLPVRAVFTGSTANGANSFAASPDFIAPDAGAVTISKFPAGYLTGVVRSSGTYRVYAQVTDDGGPASGVSSVTADLTALTAGAGTTSLTAGATTVAGVSYTHGSGSLTAAAGSGTKSYSLTMADAEGNSRTRTGYAVTYDNVVPTAAGIAAANTSGSVVGRPDPGDTLTFTYSERIDPYTILSGWTGSAQAVTVDFAKSGPNTVITVIGPSGTLPLGSVSRGGTFLNGSFSFTGSTMTQNGGDVAIVLGSTTASPSALGAGDMTWTPSTTPVDAAGNAISATARTETDNDADF